MKLTDQQSQFVYSSSRRILCLAGAGTGKTHSLISKILYSIETLKVSPDSILALTFTNAAGLEMETRYRSISSTLTSPTFCTFHSFCYKVLCDNKDVQSELGYQKIPRILDEKQSDLLVKTSEKILGINSSNRRYEFHRKTLQKYIDKILKKRNEITFDKLITAITSLFVENSPLIQKYLIQYRYIYVDEFQDTDQNQWDFVKAFSKYSNIILIGDPNQSLYQFRGANSSLIRSIAKDREWDVYKLEQNHRSTKPICDYANQIIEKFSNIDDSPKLQSDLVGPGVGITTVEKFFDKNNLSLFKDVRWNCAVLCRTNSDVKYVSSIFSKNNIEHRTKGCNQLNKLVAASLDENYKKSLLLSSLPKSEQLELVSKELTDPTFNILKALELKCIDLNNNIEACKELENYDEIELLYVTSQITLSDILESQTFKDNTIYVGTVHSVKGLEFDSVFVYNVNSDSFKLGTSEEMTNIFYVACTRAKTNLVIVFN